MRLAHREVSPIGQRLEDDSDSAAELRARAPGRDRATETSTASPLSLASRIRPSSVLRRRSGRAPPETRHPSISKSTPRTASSGPTPCQGPADDDRVHAGPSSSKRARKGGKLGSGPAGSAAARVRSRLMADDDHEVAAAGTPRRGLSAGVAPCARRSSTSVSPRPLAARPSHVLAGACSTRLRGRSRVAELVADARACSRPRQ